MATPQKPKILLLKRPPLPPEHRQLALAAAKLRLRMRRDPVYGGDRGDRALIRRLLLMVSHALCRYRYDQLTAHARRIMLRNREMTLRNLVSRAWRGIVSPTARELVEDEAAGMTPGQALAEIRCRPGGRRAGVRRKPGAGRIRALKALGVANVPGVDHGPEFELDPGDTLDEVHANLGIGGPEFGYDNPSGPDKPALWAKPRQTASFK